MAIVQFRVQDELKKETTSIFENLGLDLSSAMRMFLKRSVACKGIPFPTILSDDVYRASGAIEVMKEAQDISRKNGNSEMTLEDINEEFPWLGLRGENASRKRKNKSQKKARTEGFIHKGFLSIGLSAFIKAKKAPIFSLRSLGNLFARMVI